MKPKSIGAFFMPALILCCIFTACNPEPSTPTGQLPADSLPVNGDWIRIYLSNDPDCLHPYNARHSTHFPNTPSFVIPIKMEYLGTDTKSSEI